MPTYEYICQVCGNKFEDNRKIIDRDDPTLFPCSICGNFEILRGVGCQGFHLKGSCWSKDNYARTLGDDPRGHFAHNEDLNNAR